MIGRGHCNSGRSLRTIWHMLFRSFAQCWTRVRKQQVLWVLFHCMPRYTPLTCNLIRVHALKGSVGQFTFLYRSLFFEIFENFQTSNITVREYVFRKAERQLFGKIEILMLERYKHSSLVFFFSREQSKNCWYIIMPILFRRWWQPRTSNGTLKIHTRCASFKIINSLATICKDCVPHTLWLTDGYTWQYTL